jgi:hypothetical protein
MKTITQFVVDTFVADIDGKDYKAGFIRYGVDDVLEPHVIELIDENNVLVKGKKGMYVVENIGADNEFIMRLLERIEVCRYDEDGYDETEIVEWNGVGRYIPNVEGRY